VSHSMVRLACGGAVASILTLAVLWSARHSDPVGADLSDITSYQQELIDIGDVAPAQKISVPCRFVNHTTTTLSHPVVIKTCGCMLQQSLSDTVPPGQSGELIVEFTAPATAGAEVGQQRASIVYEEPALRTYEFIIQYKTLPWISIAPQTLAFGVVAAKADSRRELKLTFPTSTPANLLTIESTNPSVFVNRTTMNDSSTGCNLEVVCQKPQHSESEQLTGALIITRKDLDQKVSVPFVATIDQPLLVVPAELMPGFVDLAKESAAQIRVSCAMHGVLSTHADEWSIAGTTDRVTWSVGRVRVTQSMNGEMADIELKYLATRQGYQAGSITLASKNEAIRFVLPYSVYVR
jgi:Protein of unknown function (DUF1573)